jgi:hypothetical protein
MKPACLLFVINPIRYTLVKFALSAKDSRHKAVGTLSPNISSRVSFKIVYPGSTLKNAGPRVLAHLRNVDHKDFENSLLHKDTASKRTTPYSLSAYTEHGNSALLWAPF